jgi:hypothetical protein
MTDRTMLEPESLTKPPATRTSRAGTLPAGIASELEGLGEFRSNCLVIGLDVLVEDVLMILGSTFRSPITVMRADQLYDLPSASGPGTVVIRGVSDLTSPDQVRLVEWLNQADGRLQVVSSSSEPLWPLVHEGRFLESLYYRLNIITLVLR